MRLTAWIMLTVTILLTSHLASAESGCPAEGCGLSASQIDLHPYPKVRPLPINESQLAERDYRQVEVELPIYSAPNGEQTGSIDRGYLFVSVLEEIDGWVRIGEDQWVRSELLSDRVAPSRFTGVLLPPAEEQPYTVAWTLRHLRGAETPGGPEAAHNPFLYRYTLVNIYATVQVNGYNWYQIGKNQWVHQFKVAKILPVEKPQEIETEKWISIDLYEQVTITYEGDRPVFATLISSGLEEWPTNEGIFEVYVRYTNMVMHGGGIEDYYYLQDVPHSMFFDDDIALHGAYWHDGFGFRRSHGCVNMSLTDARWLFDWVQSEYNYQTGDLTGPAVYVYSSGQYN